MMMNKTQQHERNSFNHHFYCRHPSIFYEVNFINLKSIPGPVVPRRTAGM